MDNDRERHKDRGNRIRQIIQPGDVVIADHFGAVRRLTFVRMTATRMLFRWTSPSSGVTRELWLRDEEIGRRFETAGDRAGVECGDGTVGRG